MGIERTDWMVVRFWVVGRASSFRDLYLKRGREGGLVFRIDWLLSGRGIWMWRRGQVSRL